MTALVLYAARPESVPVIQCSPPSFAAVVALREGAVPHEIRWLRFDAGEHKSPEMLALSPAGTVPILVDAGDVLTDTLRILERIAERAGNVPGPAVMGDARAVKDAGMSALVALMKSGGVGADWSPLEPALEAWESRLAREPERAFDAASALVLAYVATAVSLGLDLGRWPGTREFLRSATRRDSVRATWPETWRGA